MSLGVHPSPSMKHLSIGIISEDLLQTEELGSIWNSGSNTTEGVSAAVVMLLLDIEVESLLSYLLGLEVENVVSYENEPGKQN